ncbi:MAG TPA: hypothetical protein VJ916_00940, partial [Anaerovoracaceae bacterium]|nr:hypothetical protein [Anaerovoracaceae bacterium]
GEDAKEVLSVVGEIDEKKIPITGKSRFGCWVCTLVKEDKSLKAFTENGATWLMPLREYRDWLMGLRLKPDTRQLHRRNGSVYFYKDGSLGKGSFTMNTRIEILKRLLELEVEMGIELITFDELKYIDELWDKEGDLYRRTLVELYYNIKNIALPWDSYKAPIYSEEIINTIKRHCKTNDMEFELISKLIIDIEENKHYSTKTRLNKAFNKTVSQGWLHYQNINKGLSDEN